METDAQEVLIDDDDEFKNHEQLISNSIAKLIDKAVSIENTETLAIDRIVDVVEKGQRKGFVKFKYNVRMAHGYVPTNKAIEYTIFDKDKAIESDTVNRYCLRSKMSKKERDELEKHRGTNKEMSGDIAIKEASVDAKKFFLESLPALNVTWKQLFYTMLDSTGNKDERIMKVIGSQYIPTPMIANMVDTEMLFQKYNNNAMILTNAGTAKSTTYARMGVKVLNRPSQAGMVGASVSNKVSEGNLVGSGCLVLDEFHKLEDESNIFDVLLNYMQSGMVFGAKLNAPVVKGTKTITFMDNVSSKGPKYFEENSSEMRKFLDLLTAHDKADMVGKRICHLLYGNNFRVISQTRDVTELSDKINMVSKQAISEKKKTIEEFLASDSVIKWIELKDEEYISEIEDILQGIDNDKLRTFIQGHLVYGVKQLRFAAIKLAIAENLDCFYTDKKLSLIAKTVILPAALKHYQLFKIANEESFSFFYNPKIKRLCELMNQGIAIQTVCEKLNMRLSDASRLYEMNRGAKKSQINRDYNMQIFLEAIETEDAENYFIDKTGSSKRTYYRIKAQYFKKKNQESKIDAIIKQEMGATLEDKIDEHVSDLLSKK